MDSGYGGFVHAGERRAGGRAGALLRPCRRRGSPRLYPKPQQPSTAVCCSAAQPPPHTRTHLPACLPACPPAAAWHCLATYSMYTINGLLGHKERQVLRRQLARQQGAGAAGKPLRRPVHSSASSLPSYGGAKRGGWSTGTASP